MAKEKSKLKILFVCTQNLQRSPTAEDHFKDKYETKSAGIYSMHNPVNEKLLKWADKVVVMEDFHKEKIVDTLHGKTFADKIIVLNIPDIYIYADPKLIEILKTKMKENGL